MFSGHEVSREKEKRNLRSLGSCTLVYKFLKNTIYSNKDKVLRVGEIIPINY